MDSYKRGDARQRLIDELNYMDRTNPEEQGKLSAHRLELLKAIALIEAVDGSQYSYTEDEGPF